MADDAPESDAPVDAQPAEKQGDGDRPDLSDAGKRAIAEERKARKAAEAEAKRVRDELEQLRQQQMSEQERALAEAKAQGRAEAEQAMSPLQLEVSRLQVALAKGVPAELVDRLRGDSADELEADADQLLALVGLKRQEAAEEPAQRAPQRRLPQLGQGRRQGSVQPSVASGRALYEARHQKT